MCVFVNLCVRERKKRKENGPDLSKLYQVHLWWESQNVGIGDTLTKMVLNFLHREREPEVKAIDPIMFRNN